MLNVSEASTVLQENSQTQKAWHSVKYHFLIKPDIRSAKTYEVVNYFHINRFQDGKSTLAWFLVLSK